MILPEILMNLIRQSEGLIVEFKKSTTDITRDVYDTVCSFSNREGGHIFFGVKDNGTILGVDKDCIERDKITTENANLAHGHGNLNLKTFRPFAKNPPIAKVFRKIGLADELGSGMRNSYKYTKMYSGGEPVFTEADVFTTVIPLSEAATTTVGPTEELDLREQVKEQVKEQVTIQDLIQFCSVPRSRKEMQEFVGLAGRRNFSEKYIKPLLEAGKIKMTIPDKPNSRNQKYQKVNSEG